MRKRILCVLLAVMLLTVNCVVTACQNSSSAIKNPTTANAQNGGTPPGNGFMQSGSAKSESANTASTKHTFGNTGSDEKMSGTQSQIVGKVSAVVGNQVTLTLGSYEDGFTSNGKTQTLLVPVGLKLSGVGAGGGSSMKSSTARSSTRIGTSGRSGNSGGFSFGGSGSTGTAKTGTSNALQAQTQRSEDFSSITDGMILRITFDTIDNTENSVISVRVLSK